ncbi:MAG: thiamine-monophosphate kinase [Gemmatimonadetes bacterium]|nr:thiamine-monophosphate kinase [Gemmatimonadota bacterium]
MTGELSLGPGAEFDMIRELLERWGPRAVGIGDDAAVLRLPRGDALVASVDSAVEHQHFEREWLTPREIGYRAVAAALSDLAAMAAGPVGVLIAMTIPRAWMMSVLEIADGIADAVDVVGTRILGGNLAAGGELSITTTVMGAAFAPLTRDGARPNDRVYVTGRLGGVRAAIERLSSGKPAGEFHERFARPVPRIAEARWLADRGASAAIDVSDGLLADARHLATASGVHMALESRRVPAVAGISAASAMHSGEEYELLATAPRAIDTTEFERRFGLPLTEIGRVTSGERGTVEVDGERVANAAGYDHFSR